MKPKVLLIDTDPAFGSRFSKLVINEPGFEFMGVYQDSSSAVKSIEDESPHYLFYSIDLPTNGTDIFAYAQENEHIQLACLSLAKDPNKVFVAMRNGSSAFLFKQQDNDDFLDCLHGFKDQNVYLPQEQKNMFFKELVLDMKSQLFPELNHDFSCLSNREAEIIAELLKGGINEEVCKRLYISPNTLKTHMRSIFRKMGVNSKLELILMAEKAGFLRQVKGSASTV